MKMRLHFLMLILQLFNIVSSVSIQNIFEVNSNILDYYSPKDEIYKYDVTLLDDTFIRNEKVDLQVYYETHCPFCIQFDTEDLISGVKKLGQYLNINMYPYGNAQTIDDNGTYTFKCQHGPDECYGNKLDACAIYLLGNITEAIFFNSCMMDSSQSNGMSDDASADKCGSILQIDSKPIKECAKGAKGSELLKQYGDESNKVHFPGVPYVLINGQEYNENFIQSLCAAFHQPPPPCSNQNIWRNYISSKQEKCLKNK